MESQVVFTGRGGEDPARSATAYAVGLTHSLTVSQSVSQQQSVDDE